MRIVQRQQDRKHVRLTANRDILLVRPGKDAVLRLEGDDHDLFNLVGYIS